MEYSAADPEGADAGAGAAAPGPPPAAAPASPPPGGDCHAAAYAERLADSIRSRGALEEAIGRPLEITAEGASLGAIAEAMPMLAASVETVRHGPRVAVWDNGGWRSMSLTNLQRAVIIDVARMVLPEAAAEIVRGHVTGTRINHVAADRHLPHLSRAIAPWFGEGRIRAFASVPGAEIAVVFVDSALAFRIVGGGARLIPRHEAYGVPLVLALLVMPYPRPVVREIADISAELEAFIASLFVYKLEDDYFHNSLYVVVVADQLRHGLHTLVGPQGAGKTTLTKLVRASLGSDQVEKTTFGELASSNQALHEVLERLVDAAVIVVEEVEPGPRGGVSESGVLNSLLGTDSVDVRKLYVGASNRGTRAYAIGTATRVISAENIRTGFKRRYSPLAVKASLHIDSGEQDVDTYVAERWAGAFLMRVLGRSNHHARALQRSGRSPLCAFRNHGNDRSADAAAALRRFGVFERCDPLGRVYVSDVCRAIGELSPATVAMREAATTSCQCSRRDLETGEVYILGHGESRQRLPAP